VYLVLLAAAVAILAGVVAVAMGAGGELGISRRDLPVIPPRIRTASDLARLRLPLGLFGYQTESADEVLQVVAGHLAERDAEIARLRQEVQWLGAQRNGSANAAGPAIAAQPEAESPDAEGPEWPDAEWPGAESSSRQSPATELPATELPVTESPGREPPAADSHDIESPLSASGPTGGQPSAPS
jgi:hypothetical protein